MKLYDEKQNTLYPIAYELQKLFPEIKIPVVDHMNYYLNSLNKSPQYNRLEIQVDQTLDLCYSWGKMGSRGDWDLSKHKHKVVEEFMGLMAERTEYLTKSPAMIHEGANHGLESITSAYKDSSAYISIDLAHANFSVYKHWTGIKEPNWQEFIKANMPDMHPALAESKSFRQYLFGNLNTKRIRNLQASVTAQYLKKVVDRGYSVVNVSHDEIVIELSGAKDFDPTIRSLLEVDWMPNFPVKFTPFTTILLPGEGKEARVDSVYEGFIIPGLTLREEPQYLRLKGVRADRYHRLFKEHVLEESLDPRDSLFTVEGHTASWQD